MTGISDYLKAYYRVCRLEYAPGEIPAILAVLFLGSATVSRFFALPVLEAMAAFLLLYLSGFIINALADKEIDKNYDTFKTNISKSVVLLGENTLKTLIILHVVVACALAFHITLQMNSLWPISLVLIGVFFGLGYSIKPFHFKVRGVWHAIALGSSAFFLPFIFLLFVITDATITLPLLIFIVGFSFVHYGMEFGNQAIDYIEDKHSNVRTPPVRWGMIPSLRIALAFVVFGIILEASNLYYILLAKGTFTFIHPMLTTNIVYVALLGIIMAGYYIPTKGLLQMHSALTKSSAVEECMPTLKKICNYAKWQASGILGVAIVSGILFMGLAIAPITNISDNIEENQFSSESVLKIPSEPEVEFYEDGGRYRANVTISVVNDDTERERGSLMIMVQSWVANFRLKTEFILLENPLTPNTYWNVSTQIYAHDVDDTTIKVYLYVSDVQSGSSDFRKVDERIILSPKDLYIFEVEVEVYEEYKNQKANVTVTVFNEGVTRSDHDLRVEVTCYTSYWFYSDEESVKNNYALGTNRHWSPTITDINIYEIDLGEPIFVVKLFEKDVQIDDYTIFS